MFNFNNMNHRYYFNYMITKPTTISYNSAFIIDHIWVNFMNKTTSGIVVSDVTDYYFVFCSFNKLIKNNKTELTKLKFRDFCKENVDCFYNYVSSVDWELVLGDTDVPDFMTDNLLKKLWELYNRCFSIKTKYIGKKKLYNPWLSKRILTLEELNILNIN